MHAERDGLVRITRGAESYYHQVENIHTSQKGKYPVHVLKGLNHASYIDSKFITSRVVKNDLFGDVDQEEGFTIIVERMIAFISEQEGQSYGAEKMITFKKESDDFFAKFVQAMKLEGSYQMETPCFSHNLANPDTPKVCLRGSPWVTEMQIIMGGNITDKGVSLNTFDNFHRDMSNFGQLNNTCPKDGQHPCVIEGLTVSENRMHWLNDLDLGSYPNAALETKAKMTSRQNIY
jgi:hypothetical protein